MHTLYKASPPDVQLGPPPQPPQSHLTEPVAAEPSSVHTGVVESKQGGVATGSGEQELDLVNVALLPSHYESLVRAAALAVLRLRLAELHGDADGGSHVYM